MIPTMFVCLLVSGQENSERNLQLCVSTCLPLSSSIHSSIFYFFSCLSFTPSRSSFPLPPSFLPFFFPFSPLLCSAPLLSSNLSSHTSLLSFTFSLSHSPLLTFTFPLHSSALHSLTSPSLYLSYFSSSSTSHFPTPYRTLPATHIFPHPPPLTPTPQHSLPTAAGDSGGPDLPQTAPGNP